MGKSNANYTSALEAYHKAQEQYSGNEGYKNALDLAKPVTSELTARQAEGATASAQDAARKAGYTKAQAAAIGAGRGADAYINNYSSNLAGQQAQATGAGDKALSAKQAEVGMGQAQDEAEYRRKWETAGNVLSAGGEIAGALIASDERTKLADAVSGVGSVMSTLGKSMQGQKQDESFGDSLAKVTKAYKAYMSGRKAAAKPEDAVKKMTSSMNAVTVSDRRAKIYEEASPYRQYANLNAYLYKYKPELVKTAKGRLGMDGREHVGVMAQELEKNPVTAGAVHDENGLKVVDTNQLTMANTATIADIAKEIEKLKGQSKEA